MVITTGFTVSLYEYEATIPTLWDTVKGSSSLVRQPTLGAERL